MLPRVVQHEHHFFRIAGCLASQQCPPKVRKRAFNSKHHRLSMCVNTPCRNIHGLRFSSDGRLKNSTFKIQVRLVISIFDYPFEGNASRSKTVGEKTLRESRHKNLGTQQRPLPISVSGIGRLRPYPACRTYRAARIRTYGGQQIVN